jgi:hypothetical protein
VSGSFLRPLGKLCLAIGLLAGGAAHAQIDPLQAGGLILSASEGHARVEQPDGSSARLALPPRAEISTLAPLGAPPGNDWIAAGSTEDDRGRRSLFLFTGKGSTSRPLQPPPRQQGTQRRNPILLVYEGNLAGVAWLEGDTDQSLSVRAAAWNGRAWQEPEEVSRPGPGSQLALTGAVLADGSWLLAWSGFDGEDDEIVWARHTRQGWSPVRPVSKGNTVPDITPAVSAVGASGDGALIAWSRYDGESYRLYMARFADGSWRGERVAGPSGSLYPTFQTTTDHLYLVHLTAVPRSWSVLEVDTAGKVLRRGAALSGLAERPVISETNEEGGIRLRWISGKWETNAVWERVP